MLKRFIRPALGRSCRILLLGAASTLAACGGGGGDGDDNNINIQVTPSTIAPGDSALLSWNASGIYSECNLAANGQAPKSVPTASPAEGYSTGAIEEAGTYTFTLSCSGSFGSATGSATLNVVGADVPQASRDCGIGIAPTQALLSTDGASVSTSAGIGTLCVGCSVDNPDNVITKAAEDELIDSYATISTGVLAINGAYAITVNGAPGDAGSYPAGPVGFLISTGDASLLSGDARRELTVQTLKDGVPVETYTTTQSSFLGFTTQPNAIVGGEPFTIDFLGLTYSTVPNGTVIFLGFDATKPYDAIRLGSGTKLSANELRVYAACVGADD